MAKYLVTGGAGFIGSHIVETLVTQGYEVRVLDNFSTGRWENLSPLLDHIELIRGDLRDPHVVRRAVEGVDFILHQAALPSVPRSIHNPKATHEANLTGTFHLLMAAREAGIRRLVLASSSSVYGNGKTLPKRETMKPHPLSPYAVTKLACEVYAQVFFKLYSIETVILRYLMCLGLDRIPTLSIQPSFPGSFSRPLRESPWSSTGMAPSPGILPL